MAKRCGGAVGGAEVGVRGRQADNTSLGSPCLREKIRPDSAFAIRSPVRYCFVMSTITAILDPDVDGTLHLPLPADMRSSKVKVTATLESVGSRPSQSQTLEALRALSRLGTFAGIKDPVAWQQEVREDRRSGSSS